MPDKERSWDERKLDALTLEIAERLRPVCARMPADEFDQLIDSMARVQRRWEGREARDFLAVNPNARTKDAE
jgi:hypothetical protein